MLNKFLVFLLLLTFGLQAQPVQKVKKIYIFYTNDIGGRIGEQKARFLNPNFPPLLGGGASVATVINKVRQKAETDGDLVLLVDAGDFLSNTSDLVRNSHGKAMIEYMNRIGYTAATIGVTDFDVLGKDVLRLAPLARFPFLVANLQVDDSLGLQKAVKPYTIIRQNGLKIGILGITSQSAEFIDPASKIRGLHFTSERKAAQKAVNALQAQDCDLIIAITNLGLPYDAEEYYPVIEAQDKQNIVKNSFMTAMDLAHYVKGIDFVFSGRIRRGYNLPWEDPLTHTLCFQNYPSGGNLGVVVAKYDMANKTLVGYDFLAKESSLLLLTEDEFWPDKKMASFIDSLQSAYHANPAEILGYTLTTLYRSSQGESPLGDLMSDAMLEAAGSDFAFNNYNSMRQNLPIGPITKQDIVDAFPFANELVVVKVKGSMLKDLIERSIVGSYMGVSIAGGKVVYDSKRPDGRRIVKFSVGNQPLQKDRVYRVAVSSYLAQGNSGMTPLSFLPDSAFTYTGKLIREAVVEYIKKHSPLKIQLDGRWKRK